MPSAYQPPREIEHEHSHGTRHHSHGRREAQEASRRPQDRARLRGTCHDRLPCLLRLPTIRGFYYSFTDFKVLSEPNMVGLENYQRMVGGPSRVERALGHPPVRAHQHGLQTIVAIGLAVLMHRLTKSMTIRGLLLLPYLIANVIVASRMVLDARLPDRHRQRDAGLDRSRRIAFFGDSAWALPTIALVNVWRHMGYTALLIFAGLQTIPPEVYEAASIDGAGEVRSFFKITVPLLRPVLAMVLVITVTGPSRSSTPSPSQPRVVRSTPPASSTTTSTNWPSSGSSSGTPRRSPSSCSSSSPPWPSRRSRCCAPASPTSPERNAP